MTTLERITLEPQGQADAAVIWLHGLGADGHDFEPIVPELKLPEHHAVRFIFPHAPYRSVTINQGYEMRAWYDILSMEIAQRQDEAGIRHSAAQVGALIDEELASGIDSRRIVLAGFSQGGAIALHTALRFARPLAGVMALSTYLPLDGSLEPERSEANRQLNIFQAHGDQDPVVPLSLGIQTRRILRDLDYPVQWHEYAMEHSVCLEEIVDIGHWLREALYLDQRP